MAEPLMLEGKLDLAAVPALHEALMSRSGQDNVIDLGGVSLMGALCLQALLAAARDARAQNLRFDLANVPDAVLAQMSSMGFTPETLTEGGT